MSDCIIPVQPLEVKSELRSPQRIFADKPIHCVYAICDPRRTDGYIYCEDNEGEKPKLFLFEEPFYVGQTNNKRTRFKQHIIEATAHYNLNPAKEDMILDLLAEGLEPIFVVLKDGLYLEECNKWERYYIKLIKRIFDGGSLLNSASGGFACSGYLVTESFRKNTSKNSFNMWRIPGHREKIVEMSNREDKKLAVSLRMKKLWQDEEFKKKVAAKRWTKENREKASKQLSETNLSNDVNIKLRNRMTNNNPMARQEIRDKMKESWTDDRREQMSIKRSGIQEKGRNTYIFVKDDVKIVVDNLLKFCLENNLSYHKIVNLFYRRKSDEVECDDWLIKRLSDKK